jgi:predicted esterase
MPSLRASVFAGTLVPPVGPQQELVTRHYLLTEGERDRAVELGAQVITAREADKMEQQRAVARGESQF